MMDLLREYSLEVWGNWDGIAVGDQIFKRGGLESNYQFTPTTFMCLSQVRAWISNVVCHGLSCVQFQSSREYSLKRSIIIVSHRI
jgi:hypothetical protein